MAQVDYYWQCDASLPGHPKVVRLSEILGCDVIKGLGIVTAFLCAVRRHAPDGDVSKISNTTIAHWTMSKKGIADALIESGWIDQTNEGRCVHGWSHRYAKMDERREKASERMRSNRSRSRNVRVTCASHDDETTRTVRVTSCARSVEEEEEEEEAENINNNSIVVGQAADHSPGILESEDIERVTTETMRSEHVRDLGNRWNALAKDLGLPQIEKLSKDRKAKASALVADGILDRWDEFSSAIKGSAFHLGDNDRAWKANFDWLVRPGKWRSLVERSKAPVGPSRQTVDAMFEISLAKIEAERSAKGLPSLTGEAT